MTIEDVRVYRRALTDEEVEKIYLPVINFNPDPFGL